MHVSSICPLCTAIFGIDFGFCVSIIIFLLNDGSDLLWTGRISEMNRCSEGPLNRKADISRVCVKASPAFGRRRLHRNTDYIVCRALGLAKLGLGQTWSGQTWSWPNLVLAKLGLAKLGLGQTWSGQTWIWPNLAKLGFGQTWSCREI